MRYLARANRVSPISISRGQMRQATEGTRKINKKGPGGAGAEVPGMGGGGRGSTPPPQEASPRGPSMNGKSAIAAENQLMGLNAPANSKTPVRTGGGWSVP